MRSRRSEQEPQGAVFHWPALTHDVGKAKERAKRRMEAAEAGVSLIDVAGANAGPFSGGGFYNGNDKPIYPVGEKTKLGFRSRSVTKGGTADFNEFTFDDKKGHEKLFLHAQKEMTTEVENDQSLQVGHDRTVVVQNNGR